MDNLILHDMKRIALAQRELSDALDKLYNDAKEKLLNKEDDKWNKLSPSLKQTGPR